MTTDPVKPRSRGVAQAALVLLAVYLVGIATGVGGGLFLIQRKVRQVMSGPVDGRGPIDFIFARVEAEVSHEAGLTPAERAVLHEHFAALARECKQTRVRLAGELRDSISREVDGVSEQIDPTRRAALRAAIERRVERWGLAPRENLATPVEKL